MVSVTFSDNTDNLSGLLLQYCIHCNVSTVLDLTEEVVNKELAKEDLAASLDDNLRMYIREIIFL